MMKKKKVAVLHAQIPFVQGGAELLVKNLVTELKTRGFDADLVPLLYKWYPENTLYNHMLAWRLMDLSEVNGEKIDLAISTKFPTYGVEHHNKVCWLVHQFREAYDLYNNQYGLKYFQNGQRMQKKVMEFDNRFLPEHREIYTISDNITDRLKKYNNISASTLYHPPGLVGRYLNEEYGEYILSVGRVEPLKRNSLLIQSLPYCDKKIRVKIAGKGSQIEPLQKLADELNVLDRIDFLGFVSDERLLELYGNAFAVFFAPLDEDYGYITLEAFLSKKPVITTIDAGGVLEFAKNGENGYICNIKPEDIGGHIDILYNDKTRCSKFGQEGYECVKDISWDNVIDQLTASIR